MINSLQDLYSSRPHWNTLLVWYLRAMALLLIGSGIIHWARIVGFLPWRDVWFWDMSLAWQATTVFFGVLDMVAAIGLWLTVSWGTVMWVFRAFCQIVMHSLFWEVFGRRPYEIAFYLLTIGIFALLYYLSVREARAHTPAT